MSIKKSVAIFSGGMDSTVLLSDLQSQGKEVLAISFNYGQRHIKELESAAKITQKLKIQHSIIDVSGFAKLASNSSLTNSEMTVPEGHYSSSSMQVTVVPNRNMVFLSIAAAYALNNDCREIAYGAHSGDHHVYADCRPVFVKAMQEALRLCDTIPVDLYAPYLNISKAEICKRGGMLAAPLELTWSCYKGLESHCGKCGTCVERKEAFELAGMVDPTNYS